MNLAEIFDNIGKKMLLDFENIHLQINHPGGRGNARESGLKEFLSQYLPKRYAISNGEIVDSSGKKSKECDLIIYDYNVAAPLLSTENFEIFPVEPIFSTVEVKSTLTQKNLNSAIENIKSVKSLKRDNDPIIGVLFAYTSKFNGDPLTSIAERLQEESRKTPSHQLFDFICVLDQGLIENIDYHVDEIDRKMLCFWPEAGKDLPTLLLFFYHFLGLLQLMETSPPFLLNYAQTAIETPRGGLGLGLVRAFEFFQNHNDK